MKLVHRLLLKLIALLMVIGGATVAAMWWDVAFRAMVLHQFKLHVWTQYGMAFGLLAVLVGLIGLLPSARKRTHNVISFPGVHGDVTIELDSVESTLTRMVSKMPEVKKIRISVVPAEDRRRVRVKADVLVYKGASASSARELANRITDYLTDTAVNMLGVEDVTTVDLNVRGIVVDAKPVPPPKTEERPAPKLEAPVVEESKPVVEDAPVETTALDAPQEEPATIPVAETPVAEPVYEVPAPEPAVEEPQAIAEVVPEPAPVSTEHESEGAWHIGEPLDTTVHMTGSVEDEVDIEPEPVVELPKTALADEPVDIVPAAPAIELPPLTAADTLSETVTADGPATEPPVDMQPADGETKEDAPKPVPEWKPLGRFGAWDDTDRSVKRLEE